MRKAKLYHQSNPEVKKEGYYFGSKDEIYMLHWFYHPFCGHGRMESQSPNIELFTNFVDAELSIRNLLKNKESYKGYELCVCEYHDWGIRYVAVKEDWERTEDYLLFYVYFQYLNDRPIKHF